MAETTNRLRPPNDDEFPDEAAAASSRKELEALLSGRSVPKDPETGAVVRGVVVQIGDDEIFLDVGAKSEATIAREELALEDGSLEIKIGDTIEASVVSVTDGIRLSRRMLKSARGREVLADAYTSGVPVEGRVEAVRKGGFDVALAGGARGFCPLSQIDDRRVADPVTWVGRSLTFRIVEMGERGRNIVVSRRRILEEAAAKLAAETRARLAEGAVLRGRVVSLQSYGAFVDIGGVQGLLHVSEIAHVRIAHPSESLNVGDEIDVKVLRIDAATGKVSLGMKQLAEDPWTRVEQKIQVGMRLDGRVTRVVEFGAFVEVAPGLDGLVHVSELNAGRKAADARQIVERGATLRVQVLEVDMAKRRISLARLDPDASLDTAAVPAVVPGTLLQGTVDRVEAFGVFLRIGPGQNGLVPNEELGLARGVDARGTFPLGTPMTVEVVDVDEGGRRIRLSRIRALARADSDEVERFRAREGERTQGGFSTLGDALKRGRDRR